MKASDVRENEPPRIPRHQEVSAGLDGIARIIVDSGLAVHKELGPGLLESAYECCLRYELELRGLQVRCQVPLPINYKGVQVDAGYRLDMLVEDLIIVEIKAINNLTPIHAAQLLTYLKLSGRRLGFLMNFNVALFKQGLRRLVI